MEAIFLIAFFVGLAVAGILGLGVDSRDPEYSLRLGPYEHTPREWRLTHRG